ncbi:putative none-like protein [Diaporthe ampelina]|uniref:Putative none-like protein n=1 Tax=Diaporthe ampelina TaxID=1214573 RepID=A0A0G2FNP8_9PEZI|nr:putative none-like protein [Diaporthe ampelina]
MGSNTSERKAKATVEQPREEDDEPDEWDKRIFSTGCAEENMKMTDCYFEKKDWRQCKDEASCRHGISVREETIR